MLKLGVVLFAAAFASPTGNSFQDSTQALSQKVSKHLIYFVDLLNMSKSHTRAQGVTIQTSDLLLP